MLNATKRACPAEGKITTSSTQISKSLGTWREITISGKVEYQKV